ncbi:DUF3606 domain-containing protein [Cupriavidus oxalaticus]|uniref:DUF3606 domain-containing protein n=1 Tax=Cupriavidus oxalaticus TaxID=96344 RepID=A0A4P7LI02_9BURK|nr:DUF3606 domain-containing protein [Cupriavidus oxalaticus]QBY55770.1 DUF3606 domain-containing protein [Cupriavidus oxalaticus]
MIDETSELGPLDPGRVNMMDPLEVQYWCRELRCSERQLEEAVRAAGDHIAAVRETLEGPVAEESKAGAPDLDSAFRNRDAARGTLGRSLRA